MTIRIKSFFALALLAAVMAVRSEASLSYEWTKEGEGQLIPDDDGSGVAKSFTLSDSATRITSVSVTLSLTGGWNGDMYAYLSHDKGGFAVLLNRVGLSAANSLGYATPGMDVTLSSDAGTDIHKYEASSPTYNKDGLLTGIWQADGRFIDPNSSGVAFDSAPRDYTLNVFNGLNPNGTWTLFIADRNGGDLAMLTGFKVDVGAVPEAESLVLLLAGALAVFVTRRNRRGHREKSVL